MNSSKPRRGWRERIDAGIYRSHRLGCPSTRDRRPGRRCGCDSWEISVPGAAPGKTRTVTVRGSIADARREKRQRQADGRLVPVPAPAADTPTCLTDLAKAFLVQQEPILSPLTHRNYRDDYRLRIAPVLGHLPLDQITRRDCERFVSGLARTASSHRVLKGAVGTLTVILEKGCSWHPELLPVNPARGLPLPPHDDADDDRSDRVLTSAQVRTLDAHGSKKKRIRTLLRFGWEVGGRRSEANELRWTDVELNRSRIHIRRGYSGPTKGRRTRTVTITPDYVALLADWYAESVVKYGAAADGYVWPGRGGKRMSDGGPTQACKRALNRAGLVDAHGEPITTYHGLRHTCASLLLMRGVKLIEVSRRLGHQSMTLTDQVYGHLVPDDRADAAVEAFNAITDPPETLGDASGDAIQASETA